MTKPLQNCKVISLQLIKINEKKIKKQTNKKRVVIELLNRIFDLGYIK